MLLKLTLLLITSGCWNLMFFLVNLFSYFFLVDHTRVVLSDGDPNDPYQDYINASFIHVTINPILGLFVINIASFSRKSDVSGNLGHT